MYLDNSKPIITTSSIDPNLQQYNFMIIDLVRGLTSINPAFRYGCRLALDHPVFGPYFDSKTQNTIPLMKGFTLRTTLFN